jgi:hypothetical protein
MQMSTCQLCGKIFASTGPKVCASCSKRLDRVYEKAREYLRDNPQMELDARDLAEAIQENLHDLEILISQGRFEREASDPAERQRKRLLEELQKSLSTSSSGRAGGTSRSTYGRDRHGKE